MSSIRSFTHSACACSMCIQWQLYHTHTPGKEYMSFQTSILHFQRDYDKDHCQSTAMRCKRYKEFCIIANHCTRGKALNVMNSWSSSWSLQHHTLLENDNYRRFILNITIRAAYASHAICITICSSNLSAVGAPSFFHTQEKSTICKNILRKFVYVGTSCTWYRAA